MLLETAPSLLTVSMKEVPLVLHSDASVSQDILAMENIACNLSLPYPQFPPLVSAHYLTFSLLFPSLSVPQLPSEPAVLSTASCNPNCGPDAQCVYDDHNR